VEPTRILPAFPLHARFTSLFENSSLSTLQRECLDHVIILNENHLRRVVIAYLSYYHNYRTHLGLDGDCPEHRPIEPPEIGEVIELPMVGGLHHWYTRRAA
jgi:putative transposase